MNDCFWEEAQLLTLCSSQYQLWKGCLAQKYSNCSATHSLLIMDMIQFMISEWHSQTDGHSIDLLSFVDKVYFLLTICCSQDECDGKKTQGHSQTVGHGEVILLYDHSMKP